MDFTEPSACLEPCGASWSAAGSPRRPRVVRAVQRGRDASEVIAELRQLASVEYPAAVEMIAGRSADPERSPARCAAREMMTRDKED